MTILAEVAKEVSVAVSFAVTDNKIISGVKMKAIQISELYRLLIGSFTNFSLILFCRSQRQTTPISCRLSFYRIVHLILGNDKCNILCISGIRSTQLGI